MLIYWDTLSWFQANQSLLLLLNAESLSEKQQVSLLWFDITRFLNPWFISNKNFSINLNYDEELHGNKQGFKPVSDVWSVILLILDGHHVLE